MRFRSVLVLTTAAAALAGCGVLPDPFVPYGTYKRARPNPSGEPTGVLSFDPNVRMKTEAESWPVAWAQMQPRRKIKP